MFDAKLQPVERSKRGQPKIHDKWYTRVSTFAKALDDKSSLVNWKGRQTLIGAVTAPELLALAATTDHDDRAAMNDLVERLCERAGSSAKSDLGTAIHAGTEALDWDDQKKLEMLPAVIAQDVASYGEAMQEQGLEPLMAETFIANHEYRVAGTFDRIVHNSKTGELQVLDIKTAGRPAAEAARYAALAWALQIFLYASGIPFDAEEGEVQWRELLDGQPSQETGWVAHIQQGSGKCTLIEVDLKLGRQAADVAAATRELRKYKGGISGTDG